ncbi:MAG: signal peptidase I [Desulfobulbaceae bacterium A2]|nr:MAG: signal peptidase I [Desulfobulbaceae bacterium A2]
MGGSVTSLRQVRHKSVLREYVEAIAFAILLALCIRTFVVQAFKIPSGSMLPTLKIGDHLLVNKFVYGVRLPFAGTMLVPLGTPRPSDVIVFKYPQDPKLDYIKRVVAVAGQTVEVRDKAVYVEGKPLEESHAVHLDDKRLSARVSPRDQFGPVTVPPGKVFVMGDNRDNSYDSRFWGFVDLKDIRGKALFIYWSWDIDQPLLSSGRLGSVRWNRLGSMVH